MFRITRYFVSLILIFMIVTPSDANPSENRPIENVEHQMFHDRLQDGGFGPEMIVIPAGTFRMGNLQSKKYFNEGPVHRVSLNHFAIGRSEVTFADYDRFAKATSREMPDDRGWGRGNRPVIFVSFEDATAYAAWLTEQTGQQYRLPTEAEWEYAARAGTQTKYWWGNKIEPNRAACHYCQSQWGYDAANEMTAPVCSFAANPIGLCDTVGNVSEWTCSPYKMRYNGKEQRCILHQTHRNGIRVIRGGSWFSKPRGVRVSQRSRYLIDSRKAVIGFRLVRVLPKKSETNATGKN